MSVNLYQTGVSGLLAAQQQLATTGHNIANVNTEGFNRQRAEQGAAIGTAFGDQYLGSGTYIQDVARIFNKFSYREQLVNTGKVGYADSLNRDLDQLNEIMTFSGKSINDSLNRFYQAINSISDNPSDLGLRNIALSQAEILAGDFKAMNKNLDLLENSANGEIEQIAAQVSRMSVEIAKINEQILSQSGPEVTGQANDLLDRRDQLIMELGEYANVNTVTDKNGVMTVMIGSGNTLVAGITPLRVAVTSGDPDPNQKQLQLVGANGNVGLNGATVGGKLEAKFEYRDEHLADLRSQVNRIAMAISDTLNSSQAQGLDLNGQTGLNIFTDINTNQLMQGRVLTPSTNTGSVQASVEITDISKVPTDEFEIEWDGTNYVMTNLDTRASQTLTLTPPNEYDTGLGFSFNIDSGTPAVGDSFIVRPTENSASLIDVTLQDGAGIAASTPVGVHVSENNVSDGQLKITNVLDPVAAQTYVNTTNSEITVDVYESAPGTFTYRVFDSANPPPAPVITTGTFAAGSSATIALPPGPTPAFEIEISGEPAGQGSLAREQFFLKDAFGQGNGGNATKMALTQEQGIISGGKESFNQSIGISTAEVGSKASSAKLVSQTAQALHTQAYNRVQEASGVNLDEEAANMLKFQQAYQASSRIISVANTIFDTLLAAV
ncbi:flagellar hook-associated protein FlgK [Thalassotalea marina]|uniref:Flagellar hook-associated protein 1 n=1 Tax=Thalassotalea marina TaxID=1673741 RepID=A0A919BB88_9GAMM|nr:flagellar hook-associated protein FlgK [Thalassotalea marina]GHF80257.1 flagellar hook-associated protein FlgK [Thalassotalea marina]